MEPETHSERILLVYAGWLGDLVWLVPVIHALRAAYRSVSLVVSEVQAPLAEIMRNGLVDQVYVDVPSRRWACARAVRQSVRTRRINTVLDVKGRLKTGLYMPWGGSRRLWIPAREDAREYWPARVLHPWARRLPPRSGTHMVDAFLSMLAPLGVARSPMSFQLPFSGETLREAEAIIAREGWREGRTVVLNPGSAQFSKIWPATHFRRLAEILKHDLHCKVVLMGAREFPSNDHYDRHVARETFADGLVTNLVEKTSLAVDAYLLGSGVFAVAVGNDSFAGHMAGSAHETGAGAAGAVQAPDGRWFRGHRTVSLFGPTNPVFCAPYDPTGAFNTVIRPDPYPDACVYDRQAHVCPHYGDRYCTDQAHCMQHIRVETVAAAVEAHLRAGKG